MRDQVIDLASRRTKAEAWVAVESMLNAREFPGATLPEILEDLSVDRG